MTQNEEICKKVINRLDIVQQYMLRGKDLQTFAEHFNAGKIQRQVLWATGPISVDELERWVDICMEVGK